MLVFLLLLFVVFCGLVQQSTSTLRSGVERVHLVVGGPFILPFWTPSLIGKNKKVMVRVSKIKLFGLACHYCKQKWHSNYELQELLLESSRPGGWC